MIEPELREIRVSRKAICPLVSYSIVKEMCGSMEFNSSWKVEIASFFMTERTSST